MSKGKLNQVWESNFSVKVATHWNKCAESLWNLLPSRWWQLGRQGPGQPDLTATWSICEHEVGLKGPFLPNLFCDSRAPSNWHQASWANCLLLISFRVSYWNFQRSKDPFACCCTKSCLHVNRTGQLVPGENSSEPSIINIFIKKCHVWRSLAWYLIDTFSGHPATI